MRIKYEYISPYSAHDIFFDHFHLVSVFLTHKTYFIHKNQLDEKDILKYTDILHEQYKIKPIDELPEYFYLTFVNYEIKKVKTNTQTRNLDIKIERNHDTTT